MLSHSKQFLDRFGHILLLFIKDLNKKEENNEVTPENDSMTGAKSASYLEAIQECS